MLYKKILIILWSRFLHLACFEQAWALSTITKTPVIAEMDERGKSNIILESLFMVVWHLRSKLTYMKPARLAWYLILTFFMVSFLIPWFFKLPKYFGAINFIHDCFFISSYKRSGRYSVYKQGVWNTVQHLLYTVNGFHINGFLTLDMAHRYRPNFVIYFLYRHWSSTGLSVW